ncbi:MAG: hypothetical protein LBD79_10500 [Treponema sp.]|jgi:hypothetical protein|nr:hypothetical protein [Treponema sp.]
MVYLAKKDGAVIRHTDLTAMQDLDGISTPDLTITDEEFDAAEGLARIIDGAIYLGKTEAEVQTEQNAQRIRALKGLLAGTDYIAVKIAECAASTSDYADKIAQRQAWRQEIQALEGVA